jgi:hypothetical protein
MKKAGIIVLLVMFAISVNQAQEISGNDYVDVYSMKILDNGDKILSGYFTSKIRIGNNEETGTKEYFVAGISANNEFKFFIKTKLAVYKIDFQDNNLIIFGQTKKDAVLVDKRITSSDKYQSVLASYNMESLSLNWMHIFKGSDDVLAKDLDITIDDNIVVCGTFDEDVSIDGTTMRKKDSKNNYVAVFNKDGDIKWTQHIYGGVSFITGQWISSLTVDDKGNVYLVGSVSGTASFGSKSITTDKVTFGPGEVLDDSELFLSVFDANGNCTLVKFLASEGDVEDVIVNDSHIIIAGYSKGVIYRDKPDYATTIFGGKEKYKSNIASNGDATETMFVASYNHSGEVEWLYSAPGKHLSRAEILEQDADCNIYCAGFFSSNIKINGKDNNAVGGDYVYDAFVIKLDQNGQYLNDAVIESDERNLIDDMVLQNNKLSVSSDIVDEVKIGTKIWKTKNNYSIKRAAMIIELDL